MTAIRPALGQPGLRPLLGAALISVTGDWILRVGLAYYIYVLTGSTLASAVMLLASFVPQIVLSSLAGVFADRWDKKRTMIITNLLLAAGLLPLLAAHRASQVWIIYLVVTAESCIQQFFAPAQQSVIPVLVADEHLVTANALGSQVNDVSRLAGSAAGGVLAAAGGISALTLTDIASFLVAAVLLARLPLARRESAVVPTTLRERLAGLRGEWTDGLLVATRQHTLRVVLIFLAVTCVGEGIMGTLFAPFVRSVLHGSGPDYGFVVSAQAVGGIAGGLIAAALGSRARPALLFGWGAVAFGLVDLVLFLYPLAYVAIWPAVVCMVVVGGPGALIMAGGFTLLQRFTADSHRGRVFGALGAVEGAATVAGTVAAGFLGQSVGIIPVLAAQGAGYVIAGLAVVLALRPRWHPANGLLSVYVDSR
ncbi:MAG TPA: MFS transporter [Streptosporangiaceae bacterium]|jgi:Na+/melibiose symporter-like transporter|nr:MFS transporter [Streptosporangiaceae bacterium]